MTADCLPVLLCSSDGKELAAVHCGWRSLAGGILGKTVAAMQSEPADLLAWLGPAISQAAFEVGDDVRDAFRSASPAAEQHFEANDRGRWQADLYGLARLKLAETRGAQGLGRRALHLFRTANILFITAEMVTPDGWQVSYFGARLEITPYIAIYRGVTNFP